MKRNVHYSILVLAVLLICGALIAGCTTTSTGATNVTPSVTTTAAASTTANTTADKLLIATTTSLYDTKLLDYLETDYEKTHNVNLLITSQGTGKAIELAKSGNADILLVHSPSQEKAFMDAGYGLNRRSFAYNYFIIVGPKDDPAGIKNMTPENAFKTIMAQGRNGTANISFVSRGDASGTHSAEQTIWKNAKYNYTADVRNSGKWYVEAGKGMGETLQMASEKGAYTLTDEGTFLAYAGKLNLVPVVSEGSSLLNVYSVMTVYNDKQPIGKIQQSNEFINYLISPSTLEKIGNFGKEKYGKGLFTPMSAGIPKGITVDFTTPATDIKPTMTANVTAK